jgi:glycosyltransferase involved in cell wall biosynthesis
MHILMVTPYLPFPLHSGGRIRVWEKIVYLSHNHQVTLVALDKSGTDTEVPAELRARCADVIVIPFIPCQYQEPIDIALPSLPNRIRAHRSTAVREALLQLRERMFDLVMLEQIYMAQYADVLGDAIVLEEQNIESRVLKRFAALGVTEQEMIAPATPAARAFGNAREQWKLLEDYENANWPRFPLRITVSQADKREMESRCKHGRTILVENGTNLAKIRFLPEFHEPNILFMGSLTYYPNLDAVFYFVREILPKIWTREPATTLYVAGRNPPVPIMDLAKDTRIKVIPNPDDMTMVASECRVSVVPLRFGGGSRLKILDAMAMGLPVISTSIGCEGLHVRNWKHLAICDTESEFAETVLQLLHRDDLYQRLRYHGQQLVETRCDWRKVFETLEGELERVREMSANRSWA